MGATTFTITTEGYNIKEEFDKLVEEAVDNYGENPYNGTISTTKLARELKLPLELEIALEDNHFEDVEKYEDFMFPNKRETTYSKKIKHYSGFTPKWISQKEEVSRKKGVRTLPLFALALESNDSSGRIPSYFTRTVRYPTLTEAKKKAKELALARGENVVVKQIRSNREMLTVGIMNLESDGKEYAKGKVSKSKVYLPVYEINFFVFASI